MAAPVRTFISVEVPMTEGISSLLNELKSVRNVRCTPPEQIHITLKFLGDTDPKKIPVLCAAMKAAFSGFGSFDITLKGVGAFPNAKDPRVIWIGIDGADRLADAARLTGAVLSAAGLQFDGKPFSPHMTVGRVNGKADVMDIMRSEMDREFCSFECKELRVMKSELSPKGARHTVIDTVPLS